MPELTRSIEGGIAELLDPDDIRSLGSEGVADLERLLEVFTQCANIFIERNKKRGPTWKRYGWLDSFLHVRSKFARTEETFWWRDGGLHVREPNLSDYDDQLDLINYTAFLIINHMAGNERGHRDNNA